MVLIRSYRVVYVGGEGEARAMDGGGCRMCVGL